MVSISNKVELESSFDEDFPEPFKVEESDFFFNGDKLQEEYNAKLTQTEYARNRCIFMLRKELTG